MTVRCNAFGSVSCAFGCGSNVGKGANAGLFMHGFRLTRSQRRRGKRRMTVRCNAFGSVSYAFGCGSNIGKGPALAAVLAHNRG
ncbi:hypothetical protein Pla52n_29300 [Stieleria varia]|uniref:Uncharacterized protein n=1 Tax=Stieleria varia TaxID=2528005 RepID=A0A5C6AXY8_9BACT|nr:hypothetical protein Pla52n_29300 [Stieleria varia]